MVMHAQAVTLHHDQHVPALAHNDKKWCSDIGELLMHVLLRFITKKKYEARFHTKEMKLRFRGLFGTLVLLLPNLCSIVFGW